MQNALSSLITRVTLGETTSCPRIAGCLAKSGSKVLVVDFDPQANARSGVHYRIYRADFNEFLTNHCSVIRN